MPRVQILALAAAAVLAVTLFMTLNIRGDIWFAMSLRSVKLAALIIVAIAIAISTVAFQTITANRILTPSIMGMDALYVLIQLGLILFLGGVGFASIPASYKFAGEAALMLCFALALFAPLLASSRALSLLLLAGLVLGLLFRSLSSLIARIIDPNDFAVAQYASYADFFAVDPELLAPVAIITGVGALALWRSRHVLDVMLLGRESAIALGVTWRLSNIGLLAVISLLTAASTALVGPIAFLGLLVVAITDAVIGTRRHGPMLIASSLIAIVVLVLGQAVLEHVFRNAITLGLLVELFGGAALLWLLMGRRGQ
ncbi:MAG: iron chelate uptake ABC transporter family permease subunit [Pseudomonadota bacterium]